MAEALTALTRLLVIQDIQEDENGAILHFKHGGHGCLATQDANYAANLRLAWRSRGRQHPVGVSFGEGRTVTELIRADNDVPTQLWEEGPARVRVIFQGHDGVFHVEADHPEVARIHAVLRAALGQNALVWFIAQKPSLMLLDVLPAGLTTTDPRPGDGVGSSGEWGTQQRHGEIEQ